MAEVSAASAAVPGATLGLTLIVAIGAQNAFVLRQGLRREQVGAIVAFCALAEALPMRGSHTAGVGRQPWPSPATEGQRRAAPASTQARPKGRPAR